jgi:hypothetical protein
MSFEACPRPPAHVSVKWLAAAYKGTLKASAEIEEMIWLTTADKDKISSVDQLIFNF